VGGVWGGGCTNCFVGGGGGGTPPPSLITGSLAAPPPPPPPPLLHPHSLTLSLPGQIWRGAQRPGWVHAALQSLRARVASLLSPGAGIPGTYDPDLSTYSDASSASATSSVPPFRPGVGSVSSAGPVRKPGSRLSSGGGARGSVPAPVSGAGGPGQESDGQATRLRSLLRAVARCGHGVAAVHVILDSKCLTLSLTNCNILQEVFAP
jgi:hypothetical protein